MGRQLEDQSVPIREAKEEIARLKVAVEDSSKIHAEMKAAHDEAVQQAAELEVDLLTACAQKTKQLFLERYPEFHYQFHGVCEQ